MELPPGIIILVAAAILVAVTRPWWSPLIGAGVGIFLIVGFLANGLGSGEGFANLSGSLGAGHAIGQGLQAIGALAAVVLGVSALGNRSRLSR